MPATSGVEPKTSLSKVRVALRIEGVALGSHDRGAPVSELDEPLREVIGVVRGHRVGISERRHKTRGLVGVARGAARPVGELRQPSARRVDIGRGLVARICEPCAVTVAVVGIAQRAVGRGGLRESTEAVVLVGGHPGCVAHARAPADRVVGVADRNGRAGDGG